MTSLVHYFDLSDGMKLQVKVSGCSKRSNAKVEFQLRNCSNTWVLHWGGVSRGQTKWILPSNCPTGTRNYEQKALQTPFVKVGEVYLIVIELREPKIHAIEFVLRDERLNKCRTYLLWESKGKPRNSAQQQKEDYDAAYRELQSQFSKGASLEELSNCSHPAPTKRSVDEKERPVVVSRAPTPNSHRRYDVGQWLHKNSNARAKGNNIPASPFMNLVEKCIGGDNVILRQKFQVGNHEIVILLITVTGDYHLFVASNMKSTLVLHWGISKFSATEWFNIAKELAERCQSEGQLGLIGVLVWLRFMACRQLTWNKNYNVKPREISAAQDAFTNLLQRKYSSQPNDMEILRLIMSTIGRGGQGDVGQRIRDEILVLQAVHSGADLESDIDTYLGYSSKGYDVMGGVQVRSIGVLSSKLQECLSFVKLHIEDNNIPPLMEKLLECRIELRPLLLTSHERLKDMIFLDLALDFSVKTTIERGFKELRDAHIPDILFFISLLLENSCLSTVNNEDLIFCTKDWYRICESYKPIDDQWALQAKSVIDRVRLSLTDKAQYYYDMIQPSAEYLGKLLRVEKWAIDIGNLGCWQVISAVEVRGFVTTVNELISVQNKVYGRRTVLIANKVSGEEEIPDGVVAVLTPDMPDVLSHVSVRARNSKVCFATCFDQSILRALRLKEGKAVSIQVKSTNLAISDISSSDVSLGASVSSAIPRGLTLKKKSFAGNYAVSAEEFTSEMVGAKSRNIQFLRGRVPSWIKIPISVALPFGVFEKVLSSELNKDLAYKVSSLSKFVNDGDLSKLRVIQEAILQMRAPSQLVNEFRNKMKSSRMPWHGDEGEERWNQGWKATKKVWASKWNERAYVSCRKANLNHDNLCMAVLVQEVIAADYAFVIHTRNPLSGDTSEIYTEIVKGLGETLVGAYPGRAMGFITKKSDLKSLKILGYPSKKIGLFIRKSLIFRSDSNGEDLKGYAGAGLYDSVPMDKEEEVVLDYSCDRLVTDKGFQRSIFSRIAEIGKIFESLYSSAQDIEGVVKDGEIYVVQSRTQM
ncbi:hypothetical protein MKX01_034244 [Papaver californicum]|nr:hypothetical protein MKX01_034244 [Papaver californicum]